MLDNGEQCPDRRLTNEFDCRAAANQLELNWGASWNGPNDVPGCFFANDNRKQVFYNTAPNANQYKPLYGEICVETGKVYMSYLRATPHKPLAGYI